MCGKGFGAFGKGFGAFSSWVNGLAARKPQRLCYSLIGKDDIKACFKRNFNLLASLCSWGDWFESHFVRNPEDRICRDIRPIWRWLPYWKPVTRCVEAQFAAAHLDWPLKMKSCLIIGLYLHFPHHWPVATCFLLITLAHSLDCGQALHFFGPDLDPNALMIFWKDLAIFLICRLQKKHAKLPDWI